MWKTRTETAKLLNVGERYLCPSNFKRFQGGARQKGWNLIEMKGQGSSALYNLEPINLNIAEDEIWKEYPLNSEYLISNYGQVKHPKGGVMKGTVGKDGYVRVQMPNSSPQAVHRMVMLTFNPIDCPDAFIVDHINGKRTDNKLTNLRWVFQSDNNKLGDINNTQIKEIIPLLIKKYGYEITKQKLLDLL